MWTTRIMVICAVFVIQVFSQIYRSNNQRNNRWTSKTVKDVPRVPPSRASCPERNGRFPTRTCDEYIECADGIAKEKTCPDGLLFNPASAKSSFPCQYPVEVDCTGRTQTQPPQATDECPHQYGNYLLGDTKNCGQFKKCVNGMAFIMDCPKGLAFNVDTYKCDWPDMVPSCDSEAYLGFRCPTDAGSLGYRTFKSPTDCQGYFICIDNKPRFHSCGKGRAYNDLTNYCDGIENVTGCDIEEYQKEHIYIYKSDTLEL